MCSFVDISLETQQKYFRDLSIDSKYEPDISDVSLAAGKDLAGLNSETG